MISIIHFIQVKWGYLTASLIGIGGIVAFIKNIHQIKNLSLQNKKFIQEKSKPEEDQQNNKAYESLQGFAIDFSEIVLKEIEILGISKDQLLWLLNEEFKSHPLLKSKSISYESTPVPLKNNTFIVISKRESAISLEDISKEFPNQDIFNKWRELCNLYAEAYRLPFRLEHIKLAKESAFNYSFKKIQDLVFKLQEYIYSSRSLSVKEENIYLHDFKNKAQHHLMMADFKYKEMYLLSEDISKLGEIAILLDLCISLVHKAILGYKIPQ